MEHRHMETITPFRYAIVQKNDFKVILGTIKIRIALRQVRCGWLQNR